MSGRKLGYLLNVVCVGLVLLIVCLSVSLWSLFRIGKHNNEITTAYVREQVAVYAATMQELSEGIATADVARIKAVSSLASDRVAFVRKYPNEKLKFDELLRLKTEGIKLTKEFPTSIFKHMVQL